MSYVAPAADAVTASWVGQAPDSGAVGDAVTASWYVALPAGSIVYRATVATDPPLVLPLAALRCNRRLGASTWMVLEVPAWTLILESALVAARGATLAVERGDGAQWLDFLSAVLTEVSATVDAHSGTLKLTGRVQTPSYTQGTRVLTGVESRADDAGRRAARCAVDPLLRTNDLVDDGADTWTAGIVSYTIDPSRAWMDVTEVAA